MKWTHINEESLLQRSFTLGLIGILCSLFPIIYFNIGPGTFAYSNLLNGLGIAAQLLAMSMAVLVLRRRKIKEETKEKAKKMVLVLAVALLFFFLV
ncbi:hypothetical protein [Negadavirga shengliensis]|uniref:Uncharacterized protein n=1 Tax=Negadavirga shengliensis TaxID=1389218 RepID=A0ABV9T7W6_9BACT